MNERPGNQLPVGVWAIIVAALILSVASILLHLTKLVDRIEDRSSRYGFDTFQLQNALNQTQAELRKLQADIAMSNSFSQLKKTLGSVGETPAPGATGGESPANAVSLLEQARGNKLFEDYLAIHPAKSQQHLQDLDKSNQDLSLAYAGLAVDMEGRLEVDGVGPTIIENGSSRLNSLLFAHNKQYEVLETTQQTPGKATLKVRITSNRALPETGPKNLASKTVQMEAVMEDGSWKVADDAETITFQKGILTRLQEQVKQVHALQEQLQNGKIKTTEEFLKAWNALPMIKK